MPGVPILERRAFLRRHGEFFKARRVGMRSGNMGACARLPLFAEQVYEFLLYYKRGDAVYFLVYL